MVRVIKSRRLGLTVFVARMEEGKLQERDTLDFYLANVKPAVKFEFVVDAPVPKLNLGAVTAELSVVDVLSTGSFAGLSLLQHNSHKLLFYTNKSCIILGN